MARFRAGVTLPSIRKAGGFSVDGLTEARQAIANLLSATDTIHLKQTYMNAAAVGADAIRSNAPYADTLPDSPSYQKAHEGWSHIRDAVFISEGDAGKSNVLLGVNARKAPHAYWFEMGTVKMQAKPFIRPSVLGARPEMARIIADGFNQIIKDQTS